MPPVAQKAQVMERALQQLRGKVVSGELMPGEQIRQQEMAEELGVSRVPLREALNLLADQGLLVHRPNSGYFVAKRAPNELAQISRILQLLENELLGSISWPDEDCIATLRALNEEMRAVAVADDWTPLVRLNREFHLQIYSLSPYRIILEEVKRLWTQADTFIATKMSEVSARLRTVEEHDRLIDCLIRRDHDVCLAAMEVHRASTASGLAPDAQLRLTHPRASLTAGRAMN
ncbi:GntR family transcriptional regulator [Variovorax sp. J22R115]|uniref:GntR family transcriptional regulator n=1 Tax=Variovorax sp. J22R115 TaxID=3053509 RepID=UPI0025772A41|nr:GntR family transcriptional regulator [Variovorax sp. J22R115]MDM0050538.1 GntR family transcriptional regulator [Variovorax sp. J22R115]